MPRWQYAVIDLKTREVAYLGSDLDKAAEKIVPGMCYARSHSQLAAQKKANELANRSEGHTQPACELTSARTNDPSPQQIRRAAERIRDKGYTTRNGRRRPPWTLSEYMVRRTI